MMPTILADAPIGAPSFEQATLLVALVLLAVLIQKEIGDHFADGPMRRLALALRVAMLPLLALFALNAALMVLGALG